MHPLIGISLEQLSADDYTTSRLITKELLTNISVNNSNSDDVMLMIDGK